MLHCSRTETRLIMEGRSCGVVRRYDGVCPHAPGGQLVFASEYLPWTADDGKPIPFAMATVVSVRPGTVKSFKRDERLVEQDGFENGAVWEGHIRQYYKGISDDAQVHHITFRLDQVDKGKGYEAV